MTADRLGSAVVTVGDELVLGEAANGNQQWMLETLRDEGLPAGLALSLPDDAAVIAAWIARLRLDGYRPLFVSGGLGGTHDDHSREGIARALDRPLVRHDRCFEILAGKYGVRFTEQRQRMAWLPEGCELIANPIGAPGFAVEGLYAFPGFPKMLRPMMLEVLSWPSVAPAHAARMAREYRLDCAEGEIAAEIEAFALAHPEAKVGIYPSSERLAEQLTLRIRLAPNRSETLDRFDELVQRLARRHCR